MSLHKSLVSGAHLKRQRNVLTRWERIARLKEEERWEHERSVFGLPKVKVAHHKRHKKAKKEEAVAEGEAVAAEGEAVTAEAVPAPKPEKPGKGKPGKEKK